MLKTSDLVDERAKRVNWENAYLESRILSADRLELVCILYEHTASCIHEAVECLEKGDIRGRSKAISKALSIIVELEGSLNFEAGGDIAANLSRLYRYMRERLMAANIKQEVGPLLETERLLKTVGEAWSEIRSEGASAPAPTTTPEPSNMPWAISSMADASESYTRQSWTA